jgi:hypothetical protein
MSWAAPATSESRAPGLKLNSYPILGALLSLSDGPVNNLAPQPCCTNPKDRGPYDFNGQRRVLGILLSVYKSVHVL